MAQLISPSGLLGLAVALSSVIRSDACNRIGFTRRGHHVSQFGGPAKSTASTCTGTLAGSNFRINHRHGSSSYGKRSDAPSSPGSSVEDAIDSLVKLLSNTVDVEDKLKQEAEEARLWKRLGKLQLDAGEYAESARIFRYGSRRCPSDEGLRHHCRVHDAFHGDLSGDKEDDREATAHVKVPDDMQIPATDDSDADPLFFLLGVSPDKVPANILQLSGATVTTPSLTRIVCASKRPILSGEACRFLIQSAQEAAAQRGGYTTDRHVHAPTCDIPVFELASPAVRWIRHGFERVLFPLVASTMPTELGLSADSLRIQDCFIVRYDGEEDVQDQRSNDGRPGFSSLRPHEDESLVSLTIALNDMSEFEGGGLFVASTGDLLNGDAGTILCFAGGLVHGGYPVTKGTRWILTVFLYIDKNLSGLEPGYTISAIREGAKVK